MKIKAALFDADGTTFQSESLAMKVALDVAYGHFQTEYDPALISSLSGKSFRQICDAVEENVGRKIPAEAYEQLNVKQLHDTIRVLSAQVEATPGIVSQIERLSHDGVPVAIVTSSPLERIDPCVDRTQSDGRSLREHFPKENVFSAEDPAIFPGGPRNKPDPSIYLHSLKTLGVPAQEALAFEDSLSGVKSAVRAGIPVIGYVGADHILDKDARAALLREAAANPGDGYPGVPDIIVIQDWAELPAVRAAFDRASSPQQAVQAYNRSQLPSQEALKTPIPTLDYRRSTDRSSEAGADRIATQAK